VMKEYQLWAFRVRPCVVVVAVSQASLATSSNVLRTSRVWCVYGERSKVGNGFT